MKKLFIFFLFILPVLSWSLSEAEVDSLEYSGIKRFTVSPWQTQIDFSLQRNLEINSRISQLFDINRDTSLFDLSNLYYNLNANIVYSVKSLKTWKDFLSQLDLFLNLSFNSPFSGYLNNLKDYSLKDYIQYGLGNIVGGFTVPLYEKDSLFSKISFSAIVFPLSRFSKQSGLYTTVSGNISVLYFLKRTQNWNLAFVSNHNLAYSQYSQVATDKKGNYYNIPFDVSQRLGLSYRQSYIWQMPSSVSFSVVHYFGVNTIETQVHDVSLRLSSSWKIRKRIFLNTFLNWKDRVYIYNPTDSNIRKKEAVRFNLAHTYFSIGGSYLF